MNGTEAIPPTAGQTPPQPRRAWQFVEMNTALGLIEFPVPEPGRGEVRLDPRAAGMCHSDVGLWNGTITDGLDYLPG